MTDCGILCVLIDVTNNELIYMDTETSTPAGAAVTIYSTPVCHFCQAAKEFFKENEIEYTENDVAADAEKRQEMIDLTGQMGVPVIRIGDDVIIGFDEDKVKELLQL